MKVWIDLANSPHPLLFAPIERRLRELNHSVLLTVRDHAQTLELARKYVPNFDVIGGASPRGRARKSLRVVDRVRALRYWAKSKRPHVALSHNSYAQIAAARSLDMPAVTAMDFEHQPANHLAFRLANRVLVPEAFPSAVARRQGASAAKLARYRGFKEEIYLSDFTPQASALAQLGLERSTDTAIVVARTPPSRALYHRFGNPLFIEALQTIGAQRHVRCVILARHPEQREEIARLALPNCTIPSSAVDSRSLMHAADLVLGAGGTMTREAALLGVPTLGVFAGRTPAVDRALERDGRLRRLTDSGQLAEIRPRTAPPHELQELRRRARVPIERFLDAVLAFGDG